MDIVRNHPYRLCEMVGIGFRTADKIAMSMGFDKLSTERVDEGLLYTLMDAETKGHLCMEKRDFIRQSLKILDTDGLTEEMGAARASWLLHDGRLASYNGRVYRAATAQAEKKVSDRIRVLLQSGKTRLGASLIPELDILETRLHLTLNAGTKERCHNGPVQPYFRYYWRAGDGKNTNPKDDPGIVPSKPSAWTDCLLCSHWQSVKTDGRVHGYAGGNHSLKRWDCWLVTMAPIVNRKCWMQIWFW